MTRIFSGLLFLLALLSMEGCVSNYTPMVANTPLFSQVGETQGALHAGTNGYSLQLSHTPAYHWGFTGSGAVNTIVIDSNRAYNYKNIAGEAATGFYSRLSRNGRFEIYGGIGQSSAGTSIERWFLRRIFLQPSLGISTPIIDFAFTPRFSFVNHFKNEENGSEFEVAEDKVLFFEPSMTLRGGFESFKFSFQCGLALPVSNREVPLANHYRGTILAIGIHLCFGKDYDRYE